MFPAVPVQISDGALIGELFCRMPASLRTIDPREADYALDRTTESEMRNDYSGMAFDRLTYVCLCAKDGTAAKIFFERTSRRSTAKAWDTARSRQAKRSGRRSGIGFRTDPGK